MEYWAVIVILSLLSVLMLFITERGDLPEEKEKEGAVKDETSASSPTDTKDSVPDPFLIEPLSSFDWRTAPPIKLRTFKPKYHITMGLQNITFSSFIEIDSDYLDRLTLRKQIIQDHHDIAIQAAPSVKPAADELYTWLTSSYLPTRFPTIFTLTHPSELTEPTLMNQATSRSVPLKPPSDPIKALQLLGENLDNDFLILLPSEDGDGYRLKGYVTCFPAGFNTKEKFGLKLRDIHIPVPGYKEKLEKSMDRFFERLEVGKIVLRTNWSITTHPNLYAASGGNHLYEGEEVPEAEEIDIDNTFLRCERQTLHRLPQTKALVFAFKTYMYPIREIKEDGMGEELAQAIDGLKEGSVPAMHFYKRGVVWGEQVKRFLRA